MRRSALGDACGWREHFEPQGVLPGDAIEWRRTGLFVLSKGKGYYKTYWRPQKRRKISILQKMTMIAAHVLPLFEDACGYFGTFKLHGMG